MSTDSKVGKSMLTDLLHQTNFMNRTATLRNKEFTFVNDKSIIIRRISAKKFRNNNPDAQQWITKSDIVLLVIRGNSIPDEDQIALLRYSSEKKLLFIVGTHINDTFINNQISDNKEEIVSLAKNIIWSRFGQFLTDKNHIYLIGNGYHDTNKWDFSRLKDDLIQQCTIIRTERIKQSIVQASECLFISTHFLIQYFLIS
jgi:hypothetical protein